jgi:hypothetical protein
VARISEGAVVQLTDEGFDTALHCSLRAGGNPFAYKKEQRPWVVMAFKKEPDATLAILCPIAHDERTHSGVRSYLLDPGAIPAGVYSNNADHDHYLILGVACAMPVRCLKRH